MAINSFSRIRQEVKEKISSLARELFQVEDLDFDAEVPPKPEMGDLAFPVSFALARELKRITGTKQNPRAIAEQILRGIEPSESIARVEIAGAGYINIFFNRNLIVRELITAERERGEPQTAEAQGPKRMVEHTSINPNKAAHIGHVRNAVLGDTFVRILRAAGERVEVQNYIDNTGVQVADVVVGFLYLENKDLDAIIELDRELGPEKSFDYYCWDLYTKVGLFYRGGDPAGDPLPDRLKLQSEVLHQIEEGDNEVAKLADYVATRNVECILDTMERLGITYDLLPRESEVLHLHFWDRAFEQMKAAGVIRFETEGRNKGCWVMPFESHTGTDEHEADKILVRSNGTVTYTGKDIAYQLWKLGKLGLDFHYRKFRSFENRPATWMTTSDASIAEDSLAPAFGSGATVYNVIDVRQSYTQNIVKMGVAALAPDAGSQASVHLSYEMVALTAAACDELGIPLTAEDRARPFIEMSGRKGIGVKADDLLDRLEAGASAKVAERNPELDADALEKTAHEIAVGALRYFLLKFTRNSLIAFDFGEALEFEGETGPYCQYSAVRANSIFRKLGQGELAATFEHLLAESTTQAMEQVFQGDAGDEIWSLIALAARLDEAVITARNTSEPTHLAKYAFSLSKSFNLFYHHHKIIIETEPTRRALLVFAADLARKQLKLALSYLGIPVPELM